MRATPVLCAAAAAAALVALAAAGHGRAGVAVAAGLLLGSVNALLARHALGADLDFRFTSMGRMLGLGAAAILLAVPLGLDQAPLVLAGVGVAQLLLAAVAGVAAVRSVPA